MNEDEIITKRLQIMAIINAKELYRNMVNNQFSFLNKMLMDIQGELDRLEKEIKELSGEAKNLF